MSAYNKPMLAEAVTAAMMTTIATMPEKQSQSVAGQFGPPWLCPLEEFLLLKNGANVASFLLDKSRSPPFQRGMVRTP